MRAVQKVDLPAPQRYVNVCLANNSYKNISHQLAPNLVSLR